MYVRDNYTCEEVHVFDLGNEVESIWVKIKGGKNRRDVLSEDLDEVFLQQMIKLSRSKDLIVTGILIILIFAGG